MFMITKLRGGYYQRIDGTPLFEKIEDASAYAKKYMEEHPKDFQTGQEAIHARPAPKDAQ
jgi:hypothetical protein